MQVQEFQALLKPVMDFIDGKPIDKSLEAQLNEAFPAEGETVQAIEAACHEAIKEGWMCSRGDEGRKFGRVIKPSEETHNMSVDVVDLKDIAGPHHKHPTGEVCLTMPITPTATFDGRGKGWLINPPGSQHRPTVRDGEALVLYFLPEGQIEFTETAKSAY